ncbi:probable crossover junction endonuclease EME2 isoform X2 [Fundulus heteroclitus]|uniref:probable crossover junction endonuclease EME2 isoform X2 n=1 Tax=Fundulus heteroclitus TaxID=8078 RepID=UPI00165A44F5|nr:probable crossover junction endonuclease EME2 isoform X2 [Fundulus heteroclitus]
MLYLISAHKWSFCFKWEMSVLRRAKTWEISESEDSDHDRKPAPKPKESRQERTADSRDRETRSAEEDSTNLPPPPAGRPSGAASSPPRPDASGAPSPARRRRSKEEVEAERLKAKERKEERERRRAARAREKEERRQEQRRRREAADELRSLRPENCIKSLTVCVEPALLQHEGSDILLDTLAMLEWRCSVESRRVPGSITWTRDLPQGGDAQACVEEEPLLLVLTPGDFVDVVITVKKMADSGGEETAMGTVLRPLWECLNQGANKAVTMLVTDFESDQRTEESGGGLPEQRLRTNLGMKSRDLEEVLVYLQLYKNISVVFLQSWQDVTDHVCAVTKALSKRPFKLLTERCELPFCVDGSWASGARVERDGSGLRDVWSRQIQQLNRVSPAVASAVTECFPSPRLLLQAYQNLGSEAEKKAMLAGLSVKTEGKERRIGPDISARMYRCLTAENPQLVLD